MANFSRHHPQAMVIPPRFLPVIDNLKMLFGDRLELLSVDPQWLNFRVRGRTETDLILELQEKPAELLGPMWQDFQVVSPLNARQADGLSIRWVGPDQTDSVYKGFWFY